MFAERIPFFWARRDHARLLVCAPKRHKTQTHRKFTPRWGFTGNGAPWRTARWEPLLLTQGAQTLEYTLARKTHVLVYEDVGKMILQTLHG